jgi:hypothetical protein
MSGVSARFRLSLMLLGASAVLGLLAFQQKSFGLLLLGALLAIPAPALLYAKAVPAAMVLFSAVLPLFVIETLLRDPEGSTETVREGPKYYWRSTDIGILGKPGTYTARKRTRSGETIYSVTYTLGDDGFRVTPGQGDGPERINFFGCSFTFGEGLNDDETLPYLVSRSGRYRVKNWGYGGGGPHEALAILQSDRDTRGSINVFVTAPWHAPRSACLQSWQLGAPRFRVDGKGNVIRSGECIGKPDNLLLQVALRSKLFKLYRRSLALQMTQDQQLELYLTLIEKMHRLSFERGQRFLVGFLKADESWFTGSHSNESIVARLRARGVAVVDVTLAAKAEQLEQRYYLHPLDKHPSARANEARAQLLLDALASRITLR